MSKKKAVTKKFIDKIETGAKELNLRVNLSGENVGFTLAVLKRFSDYLDINNKKFLLTFVTNPTDFVLNIIDVISGDDYNFEERKFGELGGYLFEALSLIFEKENCEKINVFEILNKLGETKKDAEKENKKDLSEAEATTSASTPGQ